VVDKPAGMLVHRGWGRDPVVLVDQVRALTRGAKVHPVGRLDRGASGLVLFGLSAEVAHNMSELRKQGEIRKQYLALVRGRPPDHGEIDHPIPKRPGGPRVRALTIFKCLSSVDCRPRQVSLVEVEPKTGRLHQVRRHLKHISHPLIGDANYGKGKINRAMLSNYQLDRLALHAHMLELRHPVSQNRLRLFAPVAEDLSRPLELMGFKESVWKDLIDN